MTLRLALVPRRAALLLSLALAFAMTGQPAVVALRDLASVDRTASPAPAIDPAVASATEPVRVVVQARAGLVDAAAREVAGAGGTVGAALPVIDGFQAVLTPAALSRLVNSLSIRAISKDARITFTSDSWEAGATASLFAKGTGATQAWAAGHDGAGVGVAVIDTGISPMADFAGRLVHGPDLSGEGRVIDTYGHGTVMAGLIGGDGADSRAYNGGYTGVAPEATLVGVKVAGRNGAADVSAMLQAMHWVSVYKDQYNIRVLNLSWGTPSTQSPEIDPLNYAVERLWRQGIVVVVSAGNAGSQAGTVRKPADDPLAITVGAYDDKQTVDASDDTLPSWTSRGPTVHGLTKPDVIAPGRHVTATRSYGSLIEEENPKGLVSPSYIRGSGSSQAAAVTSGLVALLLDARPDLTPDQVKHVLKSTASPLSGKTANDQGAGRVRLGAALTADAGPAMWQSATSSGLGSLDASRGGRYTQTDCDGDGGTDVIQGEITDRCQPWDGTSWTGTSWTGTSWTGTSWTGTSWTGTSWTGTSWTGTSWTGTSWTGGSWTGTSWTGTSWTGTSWTGTSWTGTSWTGTSWTGTSWTGEGFTSTKNDDEVLFMTAFWSVLPRWFQEVPGEISEAAPLGGRLCGTC